MLNILPKLFQQPALGMKRKSKVESVASRQSYRKSEYHSDRIIVSKFS